jgi:cell division protein FtsB
MRRSAPELLRRARTVPPAPSTTRRRLVHAILAFVTVVLVADALVGEKSFIVTSRARQEAQLESARLAALKEENGRLREERRRLTEDAATIEAEARRQLGLSRAGEVMFILKDIQPIEGSRSVQPR